MTQQHIKLLLKVTSTESSRKHFKATGSEGEGGIRIQEERAAHTLGFIKNPHSLSWRELASSPNNILQKFLGFLGSLSCSNIKEHLYIPRRGSYLVM